MPNKAIERNVYPIFDENIKSYFGGNDTATTEYMKKVKSELGSKQSNSDGDLKTIKWIEKTLGADIKVDDTKKRIIMNTSGQGEKKGGNAFKDTHEKDNDNADPTRVRIPKIHGGSREDTYESIDKEIEATKYLIEYMNKNNKKQKL
tara:strand:+ start:189 stop:629 length:441 start_codon:yes stop_codon:yes gene_type:complete